MVRVLVLGFMIAAAALTYYYWPFSAAPASQTAKEAPPVAVSAVGAQRKDVPFIITAIGNAQALNTVQIKSRVDGALEAVNFKEGERVNKGDVIARIDDRLYKAALDQAKAKLAQDQAQLETDQKDLERNRQLVTRQFATQQIVDQLTAKVGVDSALIESDKAFVTSAETNLNYTVITAPFSGLMGLRNIDPGNIVHASDTIAIATLTQQEPMAVVFSVPEAQLPKIKEAIKVGDVAVTAFDTNGKTSIATGALKVIDNQIDQTSGTIRLKAVFNNQDNTLWPGQFTPVQLQTTVRKNAVTVPTAALQRGPNGLYVWVVSSDERALIRAVEVAEAYQGQTVIVKGLSEGDQVIMSNQYRLLPNSKLRVNTAPVAATNANADRS